MRSNRFFVLISALVVFVLAVAPACEDERTGLGSATPRVDYFHIGDTDTPVPLSQFGETPESGELAIDFGTVDVDTIGRRYLFMHNSGRNDLKVSGVEFEAGSSDDFYVACFHDGDWQVNCPYSTEYLLSVGSGSDLIVQVNYAPQDVGPDQGSFTIKMNAEDHNEITVNLTGEGVTPEIQVCITDCLGDQDGADCTGAQEICNDSAPSLEIFFGDADIDAQVRRQVVIRNQGDRPLQISDLRPSGGDYNQFTVDKNNHDLPGELAVGAEATIFVVYDPFTGGNHESALEILSNDVNERKIRIRLVGRGLAPRVCPDPLILDFGNVSTGVPRVMSFTITNCGVLDLNLMDVVLNQTSSADFTLVAPPSFPQTLAPEAVVEIQVQYLPPTSGSDHGYVDIFSDDPASDHVSHLTGQVTLQGTSVPRACDLVATPFAVTFGGVVQNTAETVDLVVSNSGTDTCTLNDVQITQNSAGNEFSIVEKPAQNTQLDPGDMETVVLQYLPADLGLDTGTLSLFGNDKDTNEIRVDLNGEGVETAACDLEILPTDLKFGTVKMNNTQAMTIQLNNVGTEMCSITELDLDPSAMWPADFTITAAPPVPFTLNKRGQPNSQAQIEVTFAPTRLDRHSAALRLTSNDPDLQLSGGSLWDQFACLPPPNLGQACIPISGYSADSEIEVVPAELDFGVVTVGCNSPELHVTVYNLGSLTLNITDIYLENPADPNFEITYAPAVTHQLSGGGSFEIRLRYHPQDINIHRSNLYIESDASNVGTLAVPLFGRGTNISDQTDVFHQPDKVKSDVLFVVDNSGSMGEEQTALADNFDSFIQYATTLDVDYHIGVIANEVNETETGKGDPPRDIFPGVLMQVSGCPKIITNTTPDVIGCFADTVKLGTCCSDEQEAGLQAAWMALSPPEVDEPGQNGGFMREDAKLYIICVSDEQDQSKGDPDFYVDFFSSIKGYRNTEMMKVSAICGDSPNGCATAENGSRYIDVANRTGGIFESICTSNWANALQNLGIDAFAAIREFPLSRPADASTITVTVNGVPVPQAGSAGGANGWTYYPDTNTVFFGDGVVPEKGDRIEVSYTAACL